VVPLRIGGGTRLKIFEALAMGKAVVSTAVGAEGLPLTPGEHFLQADEPAAFAAAVIRLAGDPVLRRRLGRAGRALVRERYSWAEAARCFEREVAAVAAGTPSPVGRSARPPAAGPSPRWSRRTWRHEPGGGRTRRADLGGGTSR